MVLRCDSTISFLLCKIVCMVMSFTGIGNNRDVPIVVVVSLQEGCVSVFNVLILDVFTLSKQRSSYTDGHQRKTRGRRYAFGCYYCK